MRAPASVYRFALVALFAAASTLALAQAPPPRPTSRPSARKARTSSGCRRRSRWSNKMLDMAKLTPKDFHMDLGSGDGRTVITAAKRGARSMGVEYNPDMVELAKRNAEKAGVSARATFVKADLFETDFSKATVITLFLLPGHQPAAASQDPRHEARHAHRLQHLHHGRLEGRRDRQRRQRLRELVVHRAALDRARQGRRQLQDAAGRRDAEAGVPDALRHAARRGQDLRPRRPGARRGDHLPAPAARTTRAS